MSPELNQTDNVEAPCSGCRVGDINRQMGFLCKNVLRTQAFKAENDASSLNVPKYHRKLIFASDEDLCEIRAPVAKKL